MGIAQPYLVPSVRAARAVLIKGVTSAFKAKKGRAELRRALNKAAKQAAFFALANAQQLVPVDTGRLRSSLSVKREEPMVYSVGTNVVYARAVEFGANSSSNQTGAVKVSLRRRI